MFINEVKAINFKLLFQKYKLKKKINIKKNLSNLLFIFFKYI